MPSELRTADVLLIEDNEGDAVLTEEALRSAKVVLDLHRVADGVEALSYLRCEGEYAGTPRPDLILLDLNMPRMDGREVLKELKGDPALRMIPVVVLTTSQAEEDIIRSYQLQANCCITKPARFDQLVEVLRQLAQFWFSVVRLPLKDQK